MKYILFLSPIMLLLATSCARQTPEDVLRNACQDYDTLIFRYETLLHADTDVEIIEQARLLAIDNSLSFGSALWESFVGNDYVVNSSASPLHKALYFIDRDIRNLEAISYKLERRGLFNRPIYEKIGNLRRRLCTIARIIQAHKTYIEESQFIAQQRVNKSQLYEQQKQTNLLQEIAHNQREEKKIQTRNVKVESYNIYVS